MDPKLGAFLLALIAAVPPAYAEEPPGKHADHEAVEVRIGHQGDVHVRHVVKDSDEHQQLPLVSGTAANVLVRDMQGNEVGFETVVEGRQVLLFASEQKTVVEYDLLGEMALVDGVWTMDFNYGALTRFYIPQGVDLVFANGKPVYVGEKSGIACHGCNMLLEYAIDEPRVFESVAWEENEFLVEIRTLSGIERFVFDQPARSIGFDVAGGGKFVTAIIPTELLGDPYSVFLDGEKIHFSDYINDGTHVWLTAKPESGGRIEIVGTTVIPEFPPMVPLIAGFVAVVLALGAGTAGLRLPGFRGLADPARG